MRFQVLTAANMKILSTRMRHHVVRFMFIDVSEECGLSIFRVKEHGKGRGLVFLQIVRPHDITSQKTVIHNCSYIRSI
jgi:hypothetical protein